ncbi:MAG TPA: hypothetical protein VHE08_03615, partial [Solirubrobacterales bacterium]|nr:hypothetical protein [Solirubrobacterales bacterium]
DPAISAAATACPGRRRDGRVPCRPFPSRQTGHVPPASSTQAAGNVGPGTGRRLVVFSPAGMEEFFRAAGAASPGAEIDPRTALDAATRHGWKFV